MATKYSILPWGNMIMKNDKDMTKKDHLTKTYIGQDEIFADAVNYAVYNG